jgi:regulation of enolase protein 1 (concanavalin A-like superfamily)
MERTRVSIFNSRFLSFFKTSFHQDFLTFLGVTKMKSKTTVPSKWSIGFLQNNLFKIIIICILLCSITPLYADIPWLHTSGNTIRDPSNNVVILRGVATADIGAHESWYGGMIPLIDRVTNKSDSQGSSPGWYTKVIRLAVVPPDSGFASPIPFNASNNDYYNNLLRPAVDYCAQKDLYVIIDWHYIDLTTSHITTTNQFWTYIAPKFANDSHVMFEIFNEPTNSSGTEAERWASTKADMQNWVNLIRSYAPNNIILVGGPQYNTCIAPAPANPISGTNIVYTWHDYPVGFLAGTWEKDQVTVAAASLPVFCTEWGFCENWDYIVSGTISNYGQPFQTFIEGLNLCGWTAFSTTYDWGPPFFNTDWTLRVGNSEEGGFVKDWLYARRNSNLPVGNTPPHVTITSPSNGATYNAGANIVIQANAFDAGGSITQVQFYQGSTLLGTDTTSPYSYNWNSVAAGSYTLTARATDNSSSTTTSSPVSVTVVSGGLPTGWTAQDIGSPSVAGHTTYSSGTYTVEGSGADIWGTSDSFHYAYRSISGDGEIVARVASLENTNSWAKAGVMFRDSLNGNAINAMTVLTPTSGTGFSIRTTNGGDSTMTTGTGAAPLWVRLVRTGNTFYSYTSTNGSSWSQISAQTFTMATNAYVGLAVCSHSDGVLCTGVFDNVTVTGGGGNVAPTVSITSPANGATFTAPASVTINATASDSDGTISSVAFYQGSTLLGTDTSSPYSYTWSSVAAGSYSLTARATDNGGAVTTSAAVNITVNTGTNNPPTVSITSPANGATFTAPASVTINATASDTDGTISSVAFYQGSTLLGTDTSSPYSYAWTSVAAGSYSLTARATDNGGAVTTSSAVNITVNPAGGSAPTYQAAGSAVSGTGAITPTWPTHQSGDVALLVVESANQAISLSTAAGFVEVTNSPQGTGTAAGTAATRLAVYWKRAASSAEANPTVADSGDHQIARIITFRGVVASGNPWDVTAGNVASSASTSVSIPGATTTVANTLVAAIVARANDSSSAQASGWTNSNLTSLTERVDGGTTSGNGGGFAVATGVKATAGAYGTTTATLSTSSVQGRMSIALKSSGGTGNNPPTVSITSPANGATFTAPASVTINATASDTDGTISSVAFYQGSTLLGTDTSSPYSYTWSSVAAGSYSLTARATDNGGAVTTSSAVNITVNTAGNNPPTVSITSPANGATFTAPASITINATASDTDGTISSVAFYQGSTLLGTDTSSPYSYTWSSVAAGSYSLTARATDNGGATTTSTAVNITVSGGGGGCTCATLCDSTTSATVPYDKNGIGTFCIVMTSIPNYINSWNLTTLNINGTNLTNTYVSAGSLPAKINGNYYIYYESSVDWGHFEAR